MYPLPTFIEELHDYLTGNRSVHGNIIRIHSKKLNELGDISFPLNIKSWFQVIDKKNLQEKACLIFDLLSPNQNLDTNLDLLLKMSENWTLVVDSYKIKDNSDVHLYLRRPHAIDLCIKQIVKESDTYGLIHKCFETRVNIETDVLEPDITKMNLTELRLLTIREVTSNILNNVTRSSAETDCDIKITMNSNEKQKYILVCGAILNEAGVKDSKTTAAELHMKRSSDLRLMAQHKYGVQVKSTWGDYFKKLAKASITIEMLQNRTHKASKVTLNSLQTTNKGPAFIFYNCARLSALLKQFDEKVLNKIYPPIPTIDEIDFTVLNQPEEWEMVMVYLLQFPTLVRSCVCDIKLGIINLHYLVAFLANLSSVFSTYYRRVKILMIGKEHLLPVLYARIYLIKAVQQVFHTTLHFLNIEPVKEM